MPYTPGAPFLVDFVAEIILRGLKSSLEILFSDLQQLLVDLSEAFPRPYKMLDILISFSTGLIGRLISVPFRGVENMVLQLVQVSGLKSRALSLPNAIRMVSSSYSEIVTNLTGTSSSGLLQTLLTIVARSTYRTFLLWKKRFALVKFLLGDLTEEEFVRFFITKRIDKLKGRIAVYAVALLIVSFFSIVAWIGSVAQLLGFALSVASGNVEPFLFANDSRRAWRPRGGVARVNTRRGRDFPK